MFEKRNSVNVQNKFTKCLENKKSWQKVIGIYQIIHYE